MGKARGFSDEAEEANYQKELDDEIYSTTQQNSYNLGSTTFSDQSGIGNFAQSGSDQRKANLTGALFRGNIGFLLQTALLDVSDNTINLLYDDNGDAVSDVSSDRIVSISGGGNTADLEIILGAQRPGQRLILYNNDGNTITVKDAATTVSPTDADLIHTPGGLDYIISGFDSASLVFDFDIEQWRIIGAVGTGGGTGYNLIQDEGIPVTQRTTMNFIGTAVTAVDNPGQTRTDITINTGSGTIPSGSAENQHLEWDNSGLTWTVVDFLTMGDTGPFASDGLIRFANDQIMISSRNAADDGDIEIKVTSSDKFIFDFDGQVPLEISEDLIDVKTVDIVNIDRLKFVTSSGSMIPSDTTGILLNSNSQFQFNTADTSDFTFTFDNDDPSFVIDRDIADSNQTLVSILSDESNINSASFLNITKSFAIPVSLQEIGHLNFIAGNSLGSSLFEYASIIGKIEDNTNGSIDGSMILNATVNDSITPFIILNNLSNGIIEALRDVTLVNTTTNPVLTLFRDEVGVTDNTIGNIIFKSQTASGGDFTYSALSSSISDATLGQEDSILTLSTTNDGIFGNVQLIVNADSSQILRFASASPTNIFNSPIFEYFATTSSAPPTSTIQRIGETNFEATTNDGGGVGAVETFAQIIVDQEESDISNESGSMRFRLRDQTGTAGALKTYMQFNDGSNGRIDALKNLAMTGNDIIGIQALGFNEIGGQIAVADDSAGFNFVTTSDRPFRFTPNATNVLDIEDGGLTMLGSNDIIMGNNNVTEINQLAFNQSGQTITDNANGLRYEVPDDTDTHDFIVDGNTPLSIEKFFINFANSRLQMTQEIDPASPIAGDIYVYSKIDDDDGIAKLFYKQSDATVVGPLGVGGGGGNGDVEGTVFIVKEGNEVKELDDTLALDAELQFTPQANTVYFVEIDLRYESAFTQLKGAIEGGADMTYQIVKTNINSIGNDWSAPGSSNDEDVHFNSTGSSTEEDSTLGTCYAIVTVNNDTDPIGFSWAQLSTNFSDTTVYKGSMMRAFIQGVSGGGGGDKSFTYIISDTPGSETNSYVDTDNQLTNCDNGFADQGITIPQSPSGPTIEYTITADDLPIASNLPPGISVQKYGAMISYSGEHVSDPAATRLYTQVTKNGNLVGNFHTVFGPTIEDCSGKGVLIDVEVGDEIGLQLYVNGPGYEVKAYAVTTFVSYFTVTAKNISALLDEDEDFNHLVCIAPQNGVGEDGIHEVSYIINHNGNNDWPNVGADGTAPTIVLGNFGFTEQYLGASSSRFGGGTNDVEVIAIANMKKYQYVT